jgi:hypothetical protein
MALASGLLLIMTDFTQRSNFLFRSVFFIYNKCPETARTVRELAGSILSQPKNVIFATTTPLAKRLVASVSARDGKRRGKLLCV